MRPSARRVVSWGAEGAIRRNLVQRSYLKGIIGLPPNLFYGTGIPACLVVVDKEGANARRGIFMIDASKGFIKDGNKNRLREQDIHKIVDIFARQVELPRYSRLVPVAEIIDPKNDYNLNLPRYINSTEPEDIQDIDGHLPPSATLMLSTAIGRSSPACGPSCSKKPTAPATAS
jgi:type I restriction enzyme M protein